MRLANQTEFTIILFSGTAASVCRFRKNGQKYRLAAYSSEPVSGNDRAAAIRKALKNTGGPQGCVIVSGDLQDGGFFRCPALPVPGIREQREALGFELPRNMTRPPEDPVIQFIPAGSDENAAWNVYAFSETGLLSLKALLGPSHCKPDEFIHPLLTLRGTDPEILFPNLEKDYVFSAGQWRSAEDSDRVLSSFWQNEFDGLFLLPEGFRAGDHAESLMLMRMIASPVFREHEKCVRVLPAAMRPKRLRFHLFFTVILLLILGVIHFADIVSAGMDRRSKYQECVNERANYRRKITQIKSTLKKQEKADKELQKIMQMKAGDPDMLVRLADLCASLPGDALVTSLRFNDMTADLVIQTESESLNLPQRLKGIKYWKIGQLNQRTMNDNLSFIILKLQSTEETK